MHRVFLFVILVFTMSCKKEGKVNKPVETREIEIVNFQGLQELLQVEKEKAFVVNFWATWCKPCVEELPFFEEIRDSLNTKDVEILLVSLDFQNQLNTKVYPFLEKNGIKSRVILLDDPNENDWIPKVDSTWSGAIPATLFIKDGRREFFESSFTRNGLFEAVSKFIKPKK